ncbi:MAG: hypothetical protein AB4352_11670 [Hormoscilla sp.]
MTIKGPIVRKIIAAIIASMGLWALPVRAQTDAQVAALVEAFRLAAPDTGTENDGLYSDWQIKPENIISWSRFCRQPTTPAEFEASPDRARAIMTCVVKDLLKEEYAASGNNMEEAVRRSASWWMTGDSNRYNSDRTTGEYADLVFDFYSSQQQQQR